MAEEEKDKLDTVKKILLKATDVLCDNLQPTEILRSLKAQAVLTQDDVKLIKSETETSEQVDKLLDILSRKPITAYDIFMELLRKKRHDLFEIVGAIEVGFHYGVTAELTVKWKRNKGLECAICLDRLKTPKTLVPCLHSFCKECLVRLAPQGTKTISCPQCREKTDVPDGDVTKFRTNFHLKELVEEEAMREKLSEGGSGFTCTCCEKQLRVVAKCQECNKYLCEGGRDQHKSSIALRNHRVEVFDTQEAVEPTAVKRFTKDKSQGDLKKADWAIFDALYDEEHSIHLFGYWMKQHGKESNWQEPMVVHYLSCLADLEESGLLSDDLLAKRFQKVAHTFKQAGQYQRALELIEKILAMEGAELSLKPDNKADLYYLAGDTYREMLNTIAWTNKSNPGLIQKQIKYARQALKIRKTLEGDENKFEQGRVLRLLCGALNKWKNYGGDSLLSAEDAQAEGKKHIDEAIEIFTQLDAKGNLAKSLGTKANLETYGSKEKEKLLRQGLALCEEVYGKYSVSSGIKHWNMCLVYEDRDDYHEAFNWLDKCREIREQIYGKNHPRTRSVYEYLAKDEYATMKKEESVID